MILSQEVVAASRQSAANQIIPDNECGGLPAFAAAATVGRPTRRYALLSSHGMVAVAGGSRAVGEMRTQIRDAEREAAHYEQNPGGNPLPDLAGQRPEIGR